MDLIRSQAADISLSHSPREHGKPHAVAWPYRVAPGADVHVIVDLNCCMAVYNQGLSCCCFTCSENLMPGTVLP